MVAYSVPSGPCVLTPYCSQSFHFWQVLPTPNGQPHQGLHSGPILAQLQQTTCLSSKPNGALYTELIGFETLLARAYGFLSPCLSAILLISWQLVPWDLPFPQLNGLKPINGQYEGRAFWQGGSVTFGQGFNSTFWQGGSAVWCTGGLWAAVTPVRGTAGAAAAAWWFLPSESF